MTVFVSASATMKYAVASSSGGRRSSVTSKDTGSRTRDTSVSSAALEPAAERSGEDPVGELAQLLVRPLGVLERV